MLEEAKKKSPAEVQKSRQLGATTLDAIRSMRAMKGEIKAKSPEEQKKKMSPAKLARRMKTKEAATEAAIKQAKISGKAIQQAAAEKTKKVQGAPRQAGPAGIHSEIEKRINAHSKLEVLHNTPISDLLGDLHYIQHQTDIAHAQNEISDADHKRFSRTINGIKDVHIARANFDTLRNAINWGLPVTRELLDHMHKRSRFEFNPEEKGAKNKRDERISYLNRLAASIGDKPTTTIVKKSLMGIPYNKKVITPVYESKEAVKEHPYVKVSKGNDKKVPSRTEVAGRDSHPSGNSSGPDVDEQTIQIIKDVILERTAGRPAPIKRATSKGRSYGRRRAAVYVSKSYDNPAARIKRYQSRSRRQRVGSLIRRFH